MLVPKYHDSNTKDRELIIRINNQIDDSTELRSMKQLIQSFIAG